MNEIKGMMFAMVLVSAIAIGMSSFYTDLCTNYGVNATALINISEASDISNDIAEIYNVTTNATTTEDTTSLTGWVDASARFLDAGWKTILLVVGLPLNMVNMLSLMIGGMTGTIIPDWVISIISGFIYITIIFAVLSFIKGGGFDKG